MTAFNIATLKTDAGTQFRTEMSKSQVEGLSDLIERNVKWKTPIQIATHNGAHYLTDGFHRVEAYKALGIVEIPAGQFETIECGTMDEVFMLSIRANAAHGNKNTVEERLLMMNKLIQMDEKRYMPSRWEVSLIAIAEALQIPKGQARTVVQPKNEALKRERSAEINRLHKEGRSNGEIDTLLDLGKDYTRRFLLKQNEQVQDKPQEQTQGEVRHMKTLNAEATSSGVENDVFVMLARKDAEIAHLRLGDVLRAEYALINERKAILEGYFANTRVCEALTEADHALYFDLAYFTPRTIEEEAKVNVRFAQLVEKYAHLKLPALSSWREGDKKLQSKNAAAETLPCVNTAAQEYHVAFDTYRDVIAKAKKVAAK
ncbi:ParB-like nuclease domain protein [compost metagenome]